MERSEEFGIKLKRIRSFMDRKGYGGVLFGTQHNFCWLTCGGDNQIIHGADQGFVQILVTFDKVYLITNNIEMPRVLAEEVGYLEFERCEYQWPKGGVLEIVRDIIGNRRIASDFVFEVATNEASVLNLLRVPLTESEVSRYRDVSRMCGTAMDETMKEIKPAMDEYEIQGLIGGKLISNGIYPVVLLVGTDERIFKFRHTMPTSKKLDRYCMVVICAQRWGLIVNMTRLVHFGAVSEEIRKRYEDLYSIDMAYITATRVGNKLKDVFDAGRNAYRKAGYEGEEQRHFQGGTCGYLPREQGLNPANEYVIQEGEIFAHNPTITGTKIEDSIYVKGGEYEVLTLSDEWPSKRVTCDNVTLKRPEILIR